MDFLGCIEQRSVDIIGEFLRMKAVEGGANAPRSPTPGPGSPMVFPHTEPVIDFGELHDEDYLAEQVDGGGDDNKLVDLNIFKEKLKKKMESSLRK